MACSHVKLPGGGFALVRHQNQRRRKCAYCGKLVPNKDLRLCDAQMNGRMGRQGTCDIPLCPRCAYSPTPDTDYCPDHAEMIRKTNK